MGCSVLANSRQFRIAKVKHERTIMKIVVIGGTGLIGSKLVKKLREHGHEVVAASPTSGVNSVTGDGLADALKGASVVVDVTNSPSWEDAAVLKFFETSTRNLLDYEAAAGVRHHVALSVVGTERMLESGFFRAKLAQENLIKASSVPHARYYGITVSERTLVPDDNARLGETRFEGWLNQSTRQVPKTGRQGA